MAHDLINLQKPTPYPSIPEIRGVDPSLARILEPIKQAIEMGLGRRGDPLEQFPTLRSLYEMGSLKLVLNGRTHFSTPAGNATYQDYTAGSATDPQNDLSIPPAPTSFTVTAALATMILSWTIPAYSGNSKHAHTEIWRSDTDNLGSAAMIGTTDATLYADAVGYTGAAKYYWIRFVSVADVKGPYNAVGGTLATTGKVGNVDLTDLIVTAGKIADGAVIGTKVADGAIGAPKIAGGAVGTAQLADTAVTTGKLANLAVDNTKLAALAVDAAKLADSAVTSTKIANAAVGSAAIANAAIGTAHIADAAITNAKIERWILGKSGAAFPLDANVVDGEIFYRTDVNVAYRASKPAGVVTWVAVDYLESGNRLADGIITSAKIGNAAVGSAQIANAAIGSAHIATAAIGSAAIQNGAITNAAIANLAVDNAKIADVSAVKLTAGTVGAQQIYLGNSSFLLDGSTKRLTVNDGVRDRVQLGDLGSGAFGLTLRDGQGNVFLDSRGIQPNPMSTVINADPNFADPTKWDVYSVNGDPTPTFETVPDGVVANTVLRGLGDGRATSKIFKLVAGKKYLIKACGRATADATGRFYLRVFRRNAALTQLGYAIKNSDAPGDLEYFQLGASWTKINGTFTAEPGTVDGFIELYLNYNGASGYTGYGEIQDVRLEEITEITPYNASTYIKDLSVDTLQIAGNAVTIPVSTFAQFWNGGSAMAFSDAANTLTTLSVISSGRPIKVSFSAYFTLGGGVSYVISVSIHNSYTASDMFLCRQYGSSILTLSGTRTFDAVPAGTAVTFTFRGYSSHPTESTFVYSVSADGIEVKK